MRKLFDQNKKCLTAESEKKKYCTVCAVEFFPFVTLMSSTLLSPWMSRFTMILIILEQAANSLKSLVKLLITGNPKQIRICPSA